VSRIRALVSGVQNLCQPTGHPGEWLARILQGWRRDDLNGATMTDPEPTDAVAYAICSMSDIPSRRAAGFELALAAPEGPRRWPIVVVRWGRQVFGYVNHCPHHGSNLDWERGQFLDPDGTRLMCGKHGSRFDIATGQGIDGPCKGSGLTPVALAVIDDDICVTGVTLVEDEDDGGAAAAGNSGTGNSGKGNSGAAADE
jgi:nitrite reductase/ring-hydroxylating ferredoxin subunit